MKTLLLIITVFIAISCSEGSREGNQIKKELKMIIGKKMDIPKEIIPFNLSDSITLANCMESKYKIIYFVDSMECTECHIRYLYNLKKFFKEVDQKQSPVIVIFNTNDAFDIKMYTEKYELNFPYFLDPDKKFKSLNKELPKSEAINTFLTRNDTVILAGNPVYNVKLKELFIAQTQK